MGVQKWISEQCDLTTGQDRQGQVDQNRSARGLYTDTAMATRLDLIRERIRIVQVGLWPSYDPQAEISHYTPLESFINIAAHIASCG